MATLRKRGQSWYIHYVEDRRQIRKSLGPISKAQAEKIRKRVELELSYGTSLITAPASPRFEQYTNQYLTWYEHEYPASYDRTESIIRCHLVPWFGAIPIADIEPYAAEEWKTDRRGDAKAETVSKELRVLKAMLNRAVDWQIIDRNPIAHVKAPKATDSKPPRWYTADEMQRIYAATVEPHHQLTWQLLANTGLRRTELMQLRRKHILGGSLHILSTESERTKSGKWREVPINERAGIALEHMPGDDYIYPRVNPRSVTRAFDKCAKRADLDGSLHCLRHTYGSHLVQAGVPLRVVQQLMGHAHFSTTEKYAHLDRDHLGESANLIEL